jgi:hypothetical protein
MINGLVEYVPQFGRKFIGQTWLHEERGAALTLRAFAQLRFSVAGEQDDRNVSRSRLALQVLNELPSVGASEGQVRDHNVWVRFLSLAIGMRTVTRRDRLETGSGKACDVHFTGVVVVVDDQYQRPGGDVAPVTAVHVRGVLNSHPRAAYRGLIRPSVRI